MTASKRPSLLTWSATDFVPAMLARSPTTIRPRGGAGVQHDPVSLLNQKLGGHLSEAVGGAGDEDARHHESFRLSPAILPFQCTKKDSQDGGDNELGHLDERAKHRDGTGQFGADDGVVVKSSRNPVCNERLRSTCERGVGKRTFAGSISGRTFA